MTTATTTASSSQTTILWTTVHLQIKALCCPSSNLVTKLLCYLNGNMTTALLAIEFLHGPSNDGTTARLTGVVHGIMVIVA